MEKIIWPFGPADVLTPEYAAEMNINIDNNRTIVQLPSLTGAPTLDLVPHAELKVGAEVFIEADQGATARNVTFGTNIEGDGITGVANDKESVHLVYNGAKFRVISVTKIVDAA